MPGAAREPVHTHLYDEVLFSVDTNAYFDVVCCKVCGHYIIVSRARHREANAVETALIHEILYGEGDVRARRAPDTIPSA